jgi:hypothetical protein
MNQNPHKVLRIAPGATKAQIREAYRALARIHHPDVNKSPQAAETMREINWAYAVLIKETPNPGPESFSDGFIWEDPLDTEGFDGTKSYTEKNDWERRLIIALSYAAPLLFFLLLIGLALARI